MAVKTAIKTFLTSAKFLNTAKTVATVAAVASGVAAKRAYDEESGLQKEQGDLQQKEADIEAIRLEREHKAQRSKVKMAFIKSGVTLEGSPLLLLEEQRKEDKKFESATRSRGVALRRLSRKKASISRKRGRSALIGGIGQGASVASDFFN